MVFNSFQLHDLLILIPSLVCLVISIYYYVYPLKDKMWPAILFLALAALGLRVFMAHLDPFLWDWDERYHALVAKNLVHHPFMPTLYENPVLPYDYFLWNKNHVWLHKQPLGLWQMALSFYLFGVSQFTARFPIILESVLLVLIIYRTGTLMINKRAGYLSAFFFTVSFYALDFATGGQATDNVDFALLFYSSAAIWAWLEYKKSDKIMWLIMIGIFAGLAVLSKWLTGLLVYIAWGIAILSDPKERKQLKSYFRITSAFIISLIIFIPWQLYALSHYATEYRYEMSYNNQHIFHAIEGHSDTPWYYLASMDHVFGTFVPYILIFGIIIMWKYIKRKDYRVFMICFMIIPYLFFSLVVATKMPAYCYFACVPVFIALGCLSIYIQQFIEKLKWKLSGYFITITLLIISWFSINFLQIARLHTGYDSNNGYRINKVLFTDYFRKINKTVPKDYVIFGLIYDSEIDMMFYTGNTCYNNYPTLDEYRNLKKSGVKIAAIAWKNIPDYLQNDPEVLKIKWL